MRLNFSGQKTSQNLDACSAISNIEKMGLKDRSIKKKQPYDLKSYGWKNASTLGHSSIKKSVCGHHKKYEKKAKAKSNTDF